MELVPVVCNRCGSPLQLPANASYVTCQHCETQLAVKRNSSVAWTEAIEQIDRRTEQLTDTAEQLVNQVAKLKHENAVARIDRDWERLRESFMSVPNEMASLMAGVFAVAMGVLIGISIHPALGLLMGVIGGMAWGISPAQAYRQAHTQYRTRRSRMHIDNFLEATQPLDSPAGGMATSAPNDLPSLSVRQQVPEQFSGLPGHG